MIKKQTIIDVHDREVTPIIYTLLFAIVEINGNDQYYDIYPSELQAYADGTEDPEEQGDRDYLEEAWKERLSRGASNCYHNHEAMVQMIANPPTIKEAIKHFIQWLKDQNIDPEEPLLAKIWW